MPTVATLSSNFIFRPRLPKRISIMASSTSPPRLPTPPNKILVVGGGVIGVCTAYFLSQNSQTSVILIEKSSVACAASGKAGGFLALDWCDSTPALSSLARSSFNLHRSLSDSLNGSQSYGYRPLTTLSLPLPKTQNSSSSSSSSSSSLLPSWVDGPTGPPKTIGTTNTTAQVHPQLFTRTLLDAAVKDHGVEVMIGEVAKVEVHAGKVTGVRVRGRGEEAEERVVEGDAVVLAMGPWSGKEQILKDVFRVSGLKAHSIVVRPKEAEAITPHALFLSYQDAPGEKVLDPEVYPRPTGEVYICGMSRDAEVPENAEEITGDLSSIEMLHKIAGRVSTHLRRDEGAEVVAEQACFLPCTDDGLPVIGEIPGVKGCFVATGHSCWGILNGPATGASLAEVILNGQSSTVDLTPFSPSRFLRSSRRK